MKSMPLRLKMILGWIIIVVIPLAIIGTMFFVYVSNSLESMAKEKSIQVAEHLAGMIRSILQGELKTITALSVDPQIVEAVSSGKYNNGAEFKLKKTYARIGAEYEGIFIADKNGVVRMDAVDKKRLGIEIGNRDYFQRAKTGMASVGDPVFSKATGLPLVIVCSPIFDNDNQVAGVLVGALKIDYLVNRVASVKMGKTGYAFLLNSKGVVISHPRKEFILKTDATKTPGVEKIALRMVKQETGTEKYVYRNIKKMASFAPVEVTGWSIAVTQDWDELMATADTIRIFYLFGGSIFLLLTTAGILYFSKSISTPLQKTLNTLNKAIEQSAEIFVIIGLDRKIQFVNPAMERLMESSMDKLIGREPLLSNTKHIPPEEIWQILDQGNIWAGCVSGANNNGTSFNLEVTITPVRDDKGSISSYLEIGRDITRELRMEAQLRQGQKMEAIGTLAGGIAHDFNNILSAILGYAELAIMAREDRSKASHYIQGILNAAGRARELVSRILTFSRQTEQVKGPIEPQYLIKEALKLLRASLPATIEIQEFINSNSLIIGDPTQLHQVIMNLCTNAAYSMREKGGILKITLDDIEIDENFMQLHPGISPGLHLRLKVSDTGHGMSAENLERIFDPFFTTKPQGEGTGLGLSVVHGIVKNFNGIITVYSELHKGTEFTVYLPVIGNTSWSFEKDDNGELARGSERIMLVDDEVNIIAVETEMLENLGYSVESFNNGISALDSFRKTPGAFDVVITDYTMPHMTGLDLAKQLKEIRSDISIVLCSGHFDLSMERHADELGITERLNKPISSRELADSVRLVLDKNLISH